VHPAGPRWALWVAGFIVVALAALWGLGELPIERVAEQVDSIETRVAGIIKVFGPSAAPAAGPASPTPQLAALTKPTSTVTPTRRPTRTPTEAPTITPSTEMSATVPLTSTVAITATVEVTATLPAEAPTLAPTAEPTATPTATETPTATPTATAAPTQIPGRTTYKVKSGDTLSSIASQFGISWQELAAANGLNSRSTLRIGQELVVPLPGGSVAPTAAPPAQSPTTYTVQSGDSLSSIAQRYGITWQELANANGLTGSSRLNVGQKLIIPGTGGPAQPAPTATSAPVVAATRTPTAAPPPEQPQVPAPVLVSPSDQTPYSGPGDYIELVWEQSADLPAGAQYQVLIRWTEGGVPMEYPDMRTTAKSIRMPLWLYGKADQPARQYVWSVRVVQSVTDGQGGQKDILLSPSSATRVLYWN
jgi:LysM repeat protein